MSAASYSDPSQYPCLRVEINRFSIISLYCLLHSKIICSVSALLYIFPSSLNSLRPLPSRVLYVLNHSFIFATTPGFYIS